MKNISCEPRQTLQKNTKYLTKTCIKSAHYLHQKNALWALNIVYLCYRVRSTTIAFAKSKSPIVMTLLIEFTI